MPPRCRAVCWRGLRLHGVLSLELQGAFAMMNVSAALLYGGEVSRLTA